MRNGNTEAVGFVMKNTILFCLIFLTLDVRASELVRCPEILTNPSRVIAELTELRLELKKHSGSSLAALKEQWQQKLSQLTMAERQLLLAQMKSQALQRDQQGELQSRANDDRSVQQQQLDWLSDKSLHLQIHQNFDFRKMGKGYSDSSLLYDGQKASDKAGIQFSRNGAWAVIHGDETDGDNLLLNLKSGEQTLIPKIGRLSKDGSLLVSRPPTHKLQFVKGPEQFRTYHVESGKSFQIPGWPLDELTSADQDGILAMHFVKVAGSSNRSERRFSYNSIRSGDVVSYSLGTDIAVGSNGRYIVFVADESLKIFDTLNEQIIEGPPELRNATSIRFPDNGYFMDYDFLQFQAPGTWRDLFRKKSMILNLRDLSVHVSPNHRNVSWRYLQGTRLLYRSYHDLDVDQSYVIVRSPGTDQPDLKIKVSMIYFDDRFKIAKVGNEVWVLVGDQLILQNIESGKFEVVHVGQEPWQIHQQGFLYWNTKTEFIVHDIVKHVVHRIPQSEPFNRIVMTADRKSILTVHPFSKTSGAPVLNLGSQQSDKLAFELRWTDLMTGRFVSKDVAFADFSYNGQWLAVERRGVLEIHSIDRNLGQYP